MRRSRNHASGSAGTAAAAAVAAIIRMLADDGLRVGGTPRLPVVSAARRANDVPELDRVGSGPDPSNDHRMGRVRHERLPKTPRFHY